MQKHVRHLPGLLLILATSSAWAEETLTLYYDERPPLVSIVQGTLSGMIGTRGRQALDKAGVHYVLREASVARQDKEIAENTSPACALGRLKTKEREHKGQFSDVLVSTPPYVAIVRRDAVMPTPASLQHWAEETGLRWGVQHGLHYSDQIQRVMHTAQASVLRFSQNNQRFDRLLTAQRIDFVLMHADEANQMLRDSPLGPSLRSVALADMQAGERRYFYCSRQVSTALIQQINTAILNLKPLSGTDQAQVKP